MAKKTMDIHTFKVYLKNGDVFPRTEWGESEKIAAETIAGVYGENLYALEYNGILYAI